MLANKISTGDIFSFKLIEELGYCYVQFVKLDDFIEAPETNFAVLPFDFNSSERITSVENLIGINKLTNELLMLGLPRVRGKDKWTKIGELHFSTEDYKLPNFKDCYLFSEEIYNKNTEELQWFLIKDLDSDNRELVPYEKIKHLEIYEFLSPYLIEVRICMELLLQQNTDSRLYFDLSKPALAATYWNALGHQDFKKNGLTSRYAI